MISGSIKQHKEPEVAQSYSYVPRTHLTEAEKIISLTEELDQAHEAGFRIGSKFVSKHNEHSTLMAT